jgi:hypothetical protein
MLNYGKMDVEMYMLKRMSSLDIVWWRMKLTLDSIKEKNPNRKDYIEPMTESLIQIGEAMECMRWMRDNLHRLQSTNRELILTNEILRQQLMEIKNLNKNLLDNVDF